MLNWVSLAVLGRGKVHHKGRRRHFTDAEELRMEMEREKRKQEWRVKGSILAILSFLLDKSNSISLKKQLKKTVSFSSLIMTISICFRTLEPVSLYALFKRRKHKLLVPRSSMKDLFLLFSELFGVMS